MRAGDGGLCFWIADLTSRVEADYVGVPGRPVVLGRPAERPLTVLAFSPDAGARMTRQSFYAVRADAGLGRIDTPWSLEVLAYDIDSNGTVCGQAMNGVPGVFFIDGGSHTNGASLGECRFIAGPYWLSVFPGEFLVSRTEGVESSLRNQYPELGRDAVVAGLDRNGGVYATRPERDDGDVVYFVGLRVDLGGVVQRLVGHTPSASVRLVSVATNGVVAGYVYAQGPGPLATHFATWSSPTAVPMVVPMTGVMRSAVVSLGGRDGEVCGKVLDTEDVFVFSPAIGLVLGRELGLPGRLECAGFNEPNGFVLQSSSSEPFRLLLLRAERN